MNSTLRLFTSRSIFNNYNTKFLTKTNLYSPKFSKQPIQQCFPFHSLVVQQHTNNNNNNNIYSQNINNFSTMPLKTISEEEVDKYHPILKEKYPPGYELLHTPPSKGLIPKGAKVGKVVSTKMSKTVNVAIERYKLIIPKYRKYLRRTKKTMAHDEEEVCNEGDVVMIVPCEKLSKRKSYRVHEIIRANGVL